MNISTASEDPRSRDVGPDVGAKGRVALDNPKRLYRLLEDVLLDTTPFADRSRILRFCVERFFAAFEDDLGIESALLYDERRRYFHIVQELGVRRSDAADCIASELAPLDSLLANRSIVYDGAGADRVACLPSEAAPQPAIALVIDEPRARHLLFLLLEERADVARMDFVGHTLRSVLSARILKARWSEALNEAAVIQRALLPQRPAGLPGFDIAARSDAAEEVGGDFYDVQALGAGRRLALTVGDVSGHGLPAALVARDVLVGLRMGCRTDLRLVRRVSELNRMLHVSNPAGSFVSVFHAELESNGNLRYVNAGQVPPISFADGETGPLSSNDTVLGPAPESGFTQHGHHLDRGAAMVVVTDGILERQAASGEMFGEERLVQTVRWHLDASAEEIVDAVFAAAEAHGDATPWDDDATVMVVKRGR